jgi:hypothetical protein
MKKVLGILFLSFALLSWVACGSSGGGTESDAYVAPDTTLTDTPIGDTPIVDTDDVTHPDVVGDTPVDVPVDVPVVDVPCVPACGALICGLEPLCHTSCGTCDDTKGEVCAADQKSCVVPTCSYPTTWGPVGIVATAQIPSVAAEIAANCPDYSGDGVGDNGLKGLAGAANGELQKALDGGSFGIILEFAGVTDFVNTPKFTLNGLFGTPKVALGTEMYIDKSAYNPLTCKPLISFDNGAIAAKALTAGPSLFTLTIPLQGTMLAFTLQQAQVKAAITDGGVNATAGYLAGILTKEEVDAALVVAKESCNVPTPPDACGYISMAEKFIPFLFDLDLNADGTKDAASVCLALTLKGGTVLGFPPAATP